MEALRKLPPPTLEEVRKQFEASANWSNVRYGRFRWKDHVFGEEQCPDHVIR
jgi:hypothetical protein